MGRGLFFIASCKWSFHPKGCQALQQAAQGSGGVLKVEKKIWKILKYQKEAYEFNSEIK